MSLKVDFICVGTQKAGTTSLHDILKYHPKIYLPERKEAHFFDMDDRYKKGLNWWSETFFKGDKINKKVGVFTPEYLYLDKVPNRIKETLGIDLKIIIVLRQPAKRAYSHYLMSKRRGFESLPFSEAILKENQRLSQNTYFNYSHYSYLSRGFYCEQIKRYIDLFGRDKVKVFIFENDIIMNKEKTIKEIQNFIDVAYFDIDSNVKSNHASEPKSKLLRNMIYDKNNPLRKIVGMFPFPDSFKYKLATKLDSLNRRPLKLSKLSDEETQKLTYSYFIEDIERTEQLLSLDLSIWK